MRDAASKFPKEIETTIAVGSVPLDNGDAIYWASKVNENPVLLSYEIEPIANLFTERYMKGSGVNYPVLRTMLRGIEKVYCQQLLRAETVNTCEESISVGIKIPNYFLQNPFSKFRASKTSCISRRFVTQRFIVFR